MKHSKKNQMMAFFYLGLFIFFGTSFLRAQEGDMFAHHTGRTELNPRTGIILNEEEAPRVLNQCSRFTIKADRFWKPTQEEVDKFNQQISQYFRREHVRKPTQSLEEYSRQYIGVWSLEKKYIYVNFFYRPIAEELGLPLIKAVSICSGGDYFFGMTYNVVENTIQDVRYNSEAG